MKYQFILLPVGSRICAVHMKHFYFKLGGLDSWFLVASAVKHDA